MSAEIQTWDEEQRKWVGWCGWCGVFAPCDNPHHRWMDSRAADDLKSLDQAHRECLAVRARRSR